MALSGVKKALTFFNLSKEFDPYIFKNMWVPVDSSSNWDSE